MDVDDSSDKVRRNVVVFSSAVIAVSYLEISLSQGTLFGLHLNNASPGKLWLLFWIVSIYLLQRFHFDASTVVLRGNTKTELLKKIGDRATKLLKDDVQRVILKKKRATFIREFKPGTSLYEASRDIHPESLEATYYLRGYFKDQDPRSMLEKIKSVASTGLMVNKPEFRGHQSLLDHGAIDVEYQIPAGTLVLIVVRSFVALMMYSKSLVDLIAPYLLWVAAFCVLTYRVGVAALPHLRAALS